MAIRTALRRNIEAQGIDLNLTLEILENYNAGEYDHVTPVEVLELPEIDGHTVLDMTGAIELEVPLTQSQARIDEFEPAIGRRPDLTRLGTPSPDRSRVAFNRAQLRDLGLQLLPTVSYGVLNGGSATSYADGKKNSGFSPELFELLRPEFEPLAEQVRGKAKGITPAFVNPDGTPGPSFLELKMRALLIQALEFRQRYGTASSAVPNAPMFQMTSVYNTDELDATYREYAETSGLLSELIKETGISVTQPSTGVQPLLAAFTHSEHGRPKQIFSEAFGEADAPLAIPGGHGQNFHVLKEIYRELYRAGKRFVYLGNVDNLGFTVDPVSVAYLALTGKQAGFDFAFRTPVDVKGGILVIDQRGRYNCADIGPAISKDEVLKAEESGTPILFNCATGLFDLRYLAENIEEIAANLPMRISDQDKDAGRYSQAEQVTWEIIGMLDDFLVFGIDKYERFLAAKLLIETLMTSGIKLDDPRYPTADDPARDLHGTASKLHDGLRRLLGERYGMRLDNGRWRPLSVAELRASLRQGETT